jgi:toxin ParE1/3/4
VTNYRISDRAAADLFEIYLYGIEQFGPMQAERYKESMHHCFLLLAENPRMGRTSDTIREGLRRHEHGSHVILYSLEQDHVLIVGVLHGRSIRGLKLL